MTCVLCDVMDCAGVASDPLPGRPAQWEGRSIHVQDWKTQKWVTALVRSVDVSAKLLTVEYTPSTADADTGTKHEERIHWETQRERIRPINPKTCGDPKCTNCRGAKHHFAPQKPKPAAAAAPTASDSAPVKPEPTTAAKPAANSAVAPVASSSAPAPAVASSSAGATTAATASATTAVAAPARALHPLLAIASGLFKNEMTDRGVAITRASPIDALLGVGKVTADRLRVHHVHTLEQLAAVTPAQCKAWATDKLTEATIEATTAKALTGTPPRVASVPPPLLTPVHCVFASALCRVYLRSI